MRHHSFVGIQPNWTPDTVEADYCGDFSLSGDNFNMFSCCLNVSKKGASLNASELAPRRRITPYTRILHRDSLVFCLLDNFARAILFGSEFCLGPRASFSIQALDEIRIKTIKIRLHCFSLCGFLCLCSFPFGSFLLIGFEVGLSLCHLSRQKLLNHFLFTQPAKLAENLFLCHYRTFLCSLVP